MIESLRKIVDLNMVNSIYSNATGGKINFVLEEESGENAKISAMVVDGQMTSFIITKQQTLINTQNYQIYIDNESVDGIIEEVPMELNAETIEALNAETGWDLDNSWIGGHIYVCGVQNLPMIAGDYLFEVDADDITLETTFTIPVQYLFKKITNSEQGGGFEYYVAIRNTEGQPTDWNYTGTTFFYNGSATTEIGISEQDPSVPVTWCADWVWNDLSDESKQELEPYRYCEGFELYTAERMQGETYYTYDGSQSNTLFLNMNMINFSTLSADTRYDTDRSQPDTIVGQQGWALTDWIEIKGGEGYDINYNFSNDEYDKFDAIEFDANKQYIQWHNCDGDKIDLGDGHALAHIYTNSQSKYVRLQWTPAWTSDQSMTIMH